MLLVETVGITRIKSIGYVKILNTFFVFSLLKIENQGEFVLNIG